MNYAHRTTARTISTKLLALAGAFVLATALFSVGGPATSASAASLAQCNSGITGIDGDGVGVECDVTITNEWNLATSTGSSTIVTRVCIGAANVDFGAGDCTETTETNLADVTTTVDQCNGIANGGGSTVRCTVTITNTIIGVGTTGAPSVNQCNGSFDSIPLPFPSSFCDPVAETTGAAIDQCNDSINGETNVSIQCTVGASTVSSALPILVDQCNGSDNGGGSLLECSVSISTTFVPADDGGGDGGGSGGDGSAGGSGDGTGAVGSAALADTGLTPLGTTLGGFALLFLLTGAALIAVRSRTGTTSRA